MRITFAAVLSILGCGGGAAPSPSPSQPQPPSTSSSTEPALPPSKIKQAVAGVAKHADDVCACADAACAERTHAAYKKWKDETIATFTEAEIDATSDADNTELAMHENRLEACAERHAPQSVALDSLDPPTGSADGGTYVVLEGRGFTQRARMAKVTFGKAPGQVIRFVDDTQLVVQAPGGTAGQTVDVTVTFEPGGAFTLPAAFKFLPVVKP